MIGSEWDLDLIVDFWERERESGRGRMMTYDTYLIMILAAT